MVVEEDAKAPPECRRCNGLLYYSSHRHSQARNPLCFGLSAPRPKVKGYMKGKPDSKSLALLDFKYACIGHSVHDDVKASGSASGPEIPFCRGVQIWTARRKDLQGGRRMHTNNKEDYKSKDVTPMSKTNSSSTKTIRSEAFSARFIHNAGLVAGAVVKDLSRVGKSIKEAAIAIFHSDRGRPK